LALAVRGAEGSTAKLHPMDYAGHHISFIYAKDQDGNIVRKKKSFFLFLLLIEIAAMWTCRFRRNTSQPCSTSPLRVARCTLLSMLTTACGIPFFGRIH